MVVKWWSNGGQTAVKRRSNLEADAERGPGAVGERADDGPARAQADVDGELLVKRRSSSSQKRKVKQPSSGE